MQSPPPREDGLPGPGRGASRRHAGGRARGAARAPKPIWQAFLGECAESKAFFHGHTYGGNPLGAAAALATLDVFDQEKTLARLPTKITRLSEHPETIARLP